MKRKGHCWLRPTVFVCAVSDYRVSFSGCERCASPLVQLSQAVRGGCMLSAIQEATMSWRLAVAGMRGAAMAIALGCAVGCLGTFAFAQNACPPKDEIFGGYAYLIPTGWGDLDYKINNIPNAFDVSNTYYFCNARNLGIVVGGSGHFRGGTTPPNLENGSNDSTAVGYGLGGVQYKWHTDKLSPFVRVLVGA